MSYASKANASAISGVATSDIDDYQVTSVDEFINSTMGRNFGVTNSHVHYYDVTGSERTFQLPHFPIISITQFRDNQRGSTPSDLVEDTDYTIDKQAGLLKLILDEFNILKGSASLTIGTKTVKVTYTWGYAAVPNDITLYADWLLAWMAEIKKVTGAMKTTSGAVVRRVQIGDYQEAFDTGNKSINDKYKGLLGEMASTLTGKYRLYVDDGTESYFIHD